jgi:nucleoside-diphosphate-sugar epimerase
MIGKLNVVTGATGLLGSHIAEQLVARGERVRALVRPASDVGFLRRLGVEMVTCDLRNAPRLREALAGVDTLYHCAARVGYWGSWSQFRADVVDTTGNVLRACRATAVGRILHVSSVAVYGYPQIPAGGLNEDHPLGRRAGLWDYYCRAKIQAEQLAREYGPEVTVVRPTWVFGPRDRQGIPRLVQALRAGWVTLLDSGDHLLNILPASNVAAGAILAATHPGACGRAYHLCSEGEVSQRQFLNFLTDHLGLSRITRQVPARFAFWGGFLAEFYARFCRWKRAPFVSRYSVGLMSRPTRYCIDRARTELGWRPKMAVLDELQRTLEWMGSLG